MNLVDSSGWLEYFSGGPNADRFQEPLLDPKSMIVPSMTLFEVFKVVLREAGENEALQSMAAMQKGRVVELTAENAKHAAKLSLLHQLPMADSIILATSKTYECVIWTQDADFEKLPKVKFFPKKP
jgi:predicted nucleic acid-binding protein